MSKKLFLCTTKDCGKFYVISTDFNSAENIISTKLKELNYGFSSDRDIINIEIISNEITNSINKDCNLILD